MTHHDPDQNATSRDVESVESAVLPVPRSVRAMMEVEGVWNAWQARPSSQRDQYLEWIAAAEEPEGNAERIDQMLEELHAGDRFMGERWEK